MNYYLEITLIDGDEFSPYELWSRVYTQLHLAFAQVKDGNNKVNIGISFPQYRFNQNKGIGFLGKKLRLFAQSEKDLAQLNIRKWLERLIDYVHVSAIYEVPKNNITGYAIYRRKQFKTNAERLARHRVKRGDINFDDALDRYRHVVTTSNLPYIDMLSLSTSDEQSKKRFKLFIKKHIAEKSETQVFSTYGLSSFSSMSSVPEF